ncbi:MAG: YggS family pyridoxal phosphate-dependent enzyme [Pseudomonadota bacterium]
MIGVTENLRIVRDLLAKASVDAGRDPEAVRLLAVSKKQPVEAIQEAVAAGQRDFGENFVQEGLAKIETVGRDGIQWHFIGQLQTNKTRAVAEHFDWVHTIDRLKIAERLGRQRPDDLPDLNVCLQINIDAEDGKAGIAPDAVLPLAREVAAVPRLRLRGLMCLPAIRHNAAEQREPFARLRDLQSELREAGIETDTLSMGMSGDFVPAIAEGSTIVRIGTAVFGPRE